MTRYQQFDIAQLLEGIPQAAMLLDLSCRIVAANRQLAALTGHVEVVGLHGELVLRSNIGNHRGQLYQRVLDSGESLTVNGDMINAARQRLPIRTTITVVKTRTGKTAGLLVIVEDRSTAGAAESIDLLPSTTPELIGYSPKMQVVFQLIPLLAQTDASVMITGETGTGKDKVAEMIHRKSARAPFPFIKVNCGALPPGLLESELFGHVKGAFTGASRNKPGVFELAHQGTLFLTEIGDMPLPLQVKLLSVLDDREFVPVGGEQKIEVDVRIIAATHRPLREKMQHATFREDLFYRLHVLHLHLPPLREREEDVRYLLDHFLDKSSRALGRPLSGFTPEAMQLLLDYPYPGNIRELQNIVEYTVNICRKKRIPVDALPPYLFEPIPPPPAREEMKSPRVEGESTGETAAGAWSAGESWGEIERQMVVDSLKAQHGNRTKTAAALGWGRMKLWRKMKQYGLI